MLKLDLINTVAFGGAVLFVGHGIRRLIPPLARYNLPAPVIGGLLVALIVAQVALIAAVCWPLFYMMGRDYDAAVMQGGLCGFMLGTTANAMANMEALVDRYGPAPRAFLVVPMVGAFFIDFINAGLITFCLNLWA